jgi:hypothetical protein
VKPFSETSVQVELTMQITSNFSAWRNGNSEDECLHHGDIAFVVRWELHHVHCVKEGLFHPRTPEFTHEEAVPEH